MKKCRVHLPVSVLSALLLATISAEAVRFRLPLSSDTSVHYYYDHNTSSGVTAWNCSGSSYNGHGGSDFSGGPRGRAIFAAASGTLSYKIDGFGDGYAGSPAGGGAGNHVRIDHGGGVVTWYAHMTVGSVTGKPVGSGIACSEQVGGVGTSGSSTGLHLHFTVQVNGSNRDPYIGGCGGLGWWVNQGSGSPSTTCEGGSGGIGTRSWLQVGSNADGRLQVFGIGGNGFLQSIYQTGGSWSAWTQLGPWQHTQVTVGKNADGRLESFTIGTDGKLNHSWQTAPNGGWSNWESLDGWHSSIAVGVNADGRLQAFGIGSTGYLYSRWQTSVGGAWSAWAQMGSWQHTYVTVARNTDGRLEVFTIGVDGALNHIWQSVPNGGFSGWAGLGGWHSSIAIGMNADGRLQAFGVGSTGYIYTSWQTSVGGAWSAWSQMGSWQHTYVTAVKNTDGRLEVFTIGIDGALNHVWQSFPNGGFSSWAGLGGWHSSIAVGVNSDGRLEAFGTGTGGVLYHSWQTSVGGTWSSWSSMGGNLKQ